MRNPNKSEFFTFNPKASGMYGEKGFFTLNVGGAREIVIGTSQGGNSPAAVDWVISNESYEQLIDTGGTGLLRGDANYLPLVNGQMPLVVHSNDEYLTLCKNPAGKGATFLHVWVIR